MYINVRYCQKRWTNLYGHKEKELLEKTFSYIFQIISKFVIELPGNDGKLKSDAKLV